MFKSVRGREMLKSLFVAAVLLLSSVPAYATMHTETVEYKDKDTVLEGYLAYDDALVKTKAPAILIVHEWTGLGIYVKSRAEQIAKLGYVAFAIDIYGKGIRPANPDEAGKQATIYRNDRALMRRRALAGLEQVKKFKFVDKNKIAAMGYCFGGGVVLEMARSGADLRGVVSFHGNLDTSHPEATKNMKAKILVLHGADDPYVPPAQVSAFEKEMKSAKANWQMIAYPNAVHSFTNPDSGNDPSKGAAYNKQADERSWKAMKSFLKETF
jgi:dienelactone hydrolase